MSKPDKKSNPLVYMLVGLVVIALAYNFMGEDDSPTTTKKTKKTSSAKETDDIFTKEDYKAQFASLNKPIRNAFRPLIMKAGAGGGPGGIPAVYANGEGNWIYSGCVWINGTKNALIENTQSGDGDWVKVGEPWKAAKVVSIGEEDLVLDGPGGPVTLKLGQSGKETVVSSLPPATPNGITGPIGGQMAFGNMPNGGFDPNAQQALGNNNGNDFQNRGGRRGRRGGGGF